MDKALMLLIAGFLDFAGLLLFILSFLGIGLPFSFILDIVGAATIGVWFLNKKKWGFMSKVIKYGTAQLVELLPFLGDIVPSWTILVLSS